MNSEILFSKEQRWKKETKVNSTPPTITVLTKMHKKQAAIRPIIK
jgi:hypothetical protein